jgi:hypothetical protein
MGCSAFALCFAALLCAGLAASLFAVGAAKFKWSQNSNSYHQRQGGGERQTTHKNTLFYINCTRLWSCEMLGC